jgi:Uma2 family endonuclease
VDISDWLDETPRMGEAAREKKMSPVEYLALERASEMKHEYADGEIFAMSGGTFEHSATAANILGELRSALADRGCSVLTSDMRVHIPATGRYVYPDGSVVCAEPAFEDDKRDTLMNPMVVIEVLSDSSEAYDRGDKFAQYRTVPSIQEYVLASQKAPCIEVFTRQADGSWVLRTYQAGERAVLSAVGCELPVDEAYRRVFSAGRGSQ